MFWIFVVPVVLIAIFHSGVFYNLRIRPYWLAVAVYYLPFIWVLIAGIVKIRQEKIGFKELGFRFDNINIQSILIYIFLAVITLVCLFIVYHINYRGLDEAWYTYPHFRSGIILPVSLYQQFLYFGFLQSYLKKFLWDKKWIILVSTILFILLHLTYIQYSFFWIFIIGVSLYGFLASYVFYRYPNLILSY